MCIDEPINYFGYHSIRRVIGIFGKIYGRLKTTGEEQDLHGPAQVFENGKTMVLIGKKAGASALFVPRRLKARVVGGECLLISRLISISVTVEFFGQSFADTYHHSCTPRNGITEREKWHTEREKERGVETEREMAATREKWSCSDVRTEREKWQNRERD